MLKNPSEKDVSAIVADSSVVQRTTTHCTGSPIQNTFATTPDIVRGTLTSIEDVCTDALGSAGKALQGTSPTGIVQTIPCVSSFTEFKDSKLPSGTEVSDCLGKNRCHYFTHRRTGSASASAS